MVDLEAHGFSFGETPLPSVELLTTGSVSFPEIVYDVPLDPEVVPGLVELEVAVPRLRPAVW
jgi:hypothetical protein